MGELRQLTEPYYSKGIVTERVLPLMVKAQAAASSDKVTAGG